MFAMWESYSVKMFFVPETSEAVETVSLDSKSVGSLPADSALKSDSTLRQKPQNECAQTNNGDKK